MVSSRPSSPGVTRSHTKRACGATAAATGRITRRYTGRVTANSGRSSGWRSCSFNQVRMSARRLYAVTIPKITATVRPNPKIAWPAMCATRSNERQKM